MTASKQDKGLTMKLTDYIQEHHSGSKGAFAKSKGVGITQVVRWLKMDCIVINGEVWRRVTVINR